MLFRSDVLISASCINVKNKIAMHSRFVLVTILICLNFVSCKHDVVETVYNLDGMRILRRDWNECMTEMVYVNKEGDNIGSALFYYPGRDGWFLIDNVFDDNGTIYLVLNDACPKVIINDSSHFVVTHQPAKVRVRKNRWIRISSNDDAPVVKRANDEYGTIVTKTVGKSTTIPTSQWNTYTGSLYNTPMEESNRYAR